MAAALPVLVIVVPLMTAVLMPIVGRFWRGGPWVLTTAALGFSAGGCIDLLLRTLDGSTITYSMGGWGAPAGIDYVVDRLNALILVMVSVAGVLTAVWMRKSVIAEVTQRARTAYYAVFLLFATGLMGITITGDVFNLYVFLEIASITSYVLIAMGRHRKAYYAGFSYLILGSLGATFILLGIGHLYMATGSLAMSDIAQRLPELYDGTMAPTLMTGFAFFTVGFALKMALFPLHGWQPAAYTEAPSSASIFLAATATKISAYGFYRVSFTLFGASFLTDVLPVVQDAILVMCMAAIVVGPLLAITQDNLKRLFAYSSVGQIGYIMLGVVLFSSDQPEQIDGIAGGILHFWNHAAAKGALFMCAGAIVYRTGAARIEHLSGLGRRAPWTAAVMTVACLSMIGVPLTAGFWSKWLLASGALQTGHGGVVVVLLISSLLTAVYSWRILQRVWFAPASVTPKMEREVPWSMRVPALVLGACCLFFFFWNTPMAWAREAARGLLP